MHLGALHTGKEKPRWWRSPMGKFLGNDSKRMYLPFTQGGPEDIAYNNCKEMLELFDKHNSNYEFSEMPGGHSWMVWRRDLFHFAQALFR
jgi:enterochelin esterase-like enzyme